MNLLARVRLALARMLKPGDMKGIILTGLIVGACGLAITVLTARQNSPVVSLERDIGIVVNFVGASPSEDGTDSGGNRFLYGIRLGRDNALAFVYGHSNERLTTGSRVSVERQRRKNGTETYRLLTD